MQLLLQFNSLLNYYRILNYTEVNGVNEYPIGTNGQKYYKPAPVFRYSIVNVHGEWERERENFYFPNDILLLFLLNGLVCVLIE